jgi:hypothetical protein
MTRDKWTKLHVVENTFEWDIVKDALDRDGIEYLVREHKETAYDGLFVLQKGYATVFVREEDRVAAEEIIQNLKRMPYVVFSKD